jgi:hypothetical protein
MTHTSIHIACMRVCCTRSHTRARKHALTRTISPSHSLPLTPTPHPPTHPRTLGYGETQNAEVREEKFVPLASSGELEEGRGVRVGGGQGDEQGPGSTRGAAVVVQGGVGGVVNTTGVVVGLKPAQGPLVIFVFFYMYI